MTQQQKQRERPKQTPHRNVGEIVIATLDLLLGLPLAIFLMVMIPQQPPGSLANWLIVGSWVLIAFALVSAGLALLLRQRSLARVFQWLAALGGLCTLGAFAYELWKVSPFEWPLILILYLSGILLAALGLMLLPFWLRKMGDDE
ncbi:hypothetical protein [Armatimonas sp.]|uniref:hypothetical protein n=1 Tax=Armatimonas sp. TaxID=1872638 RepID=UPI00286CBD6D|nr:hypothetical protein [Armatimonas sp.]